MESPGQMVAIYASVLTARCRAPIINVVSNVLGLYKFKGHIITYLIEGNDSALSFKQFGFVLLVMLLRFES